MAIAGVFGASVTAFGPAWHHMPFWRPPGGPITPKWLKTLAKADLATWRPDRCAAPRRPLESHPRNCGQLQNLRVLRCRCWLVPGLLWLHQLLVSPLQEHIFFLGRGSFFWGWKLQSRVAIKHLPQWNLCLTDAGIPEKKMAGQGPKKRLGLAVSALAFKVLNALVV